MKIDKPDNVLLLQGYHALGGKPALMITLAYTLEANAQLLPEQQVWPWLLSHFVDQPFDAGFKKDRAVFGVAGKAYAPGGNPVPSMAVRAQVGALNKTLHVHGDRNWSRGAAGWQPGPAQEFTAMPVTLSRAFGGAGWLDNPFGKGWHQGLVPEAGLALPNIELPDHPILSLDDQPAVATFSMLPAGAPARLRWIGQVDANWQRERFPWLPDDTDSRWFDGVPSDQGMSGYWQGNESWSVQGMHPDSAVVTGTLPGLRPRLLVRRQALKGQEGAVAEALLDLDTVWLFPNEERLMLMYRAAIPVAREDAADIAALGVFTEMQVDTPQTADALIQRWKAEQQQDSDILTGLAPVSTNEAEAIDPQLMAEQEADTQKWVDELTADIQKSLDEGADAGNAAMAQMQADTPSLSMDIPKITAPRLAPITFESPAEVNWDGFEENLEAEIKQSLQEGQDLLEAQVREQAKLAGLDPDEVLAQVKAVQARPEALDHKSITEHIAALDLPDDMRPVVMEKAQGVQDEMDAMDTEFAMMDAQFDQMQANLAALPMASLAGDMGSQELGREQVIERLTNGTSLSGAILNKLDFSGVQFGAADLTQAVITLCDFTGADLTGAVLDQAKLEGCNFSQVKLEKASLNQIDIVDTKFIEADCQSVIMQHASLTNVDLSRSNWTKAVLDASSIGQSILHYAVFIQASMAATNLWEINGQSVDFSQGCLAGLRLDTDSVLEHATFTQANLQGASLQDSNLSHALFNQADLSDAFIKNCLLDASVGWRALAKRTDFKGSSLLNARWPAANFMQASFDSAVLENVDFSGVNLHAADARTAKVFGIQLQGALLTNCLIVQQHGPTAGVRS